MLVDCCCWATAGVETLPAGPFLRPARVDGLGLEPLLASGRPLVLGCLVRAGYAGGVAGLPWPDATANRGAAAKGGALAGQSCCCSYTKLPGRSWRPLALRLTMPGDTLSAFCAGLASGPSVAARNNPPGATRPVKAWPSADVTAEAAALPTALPMLSVSELAAAEVREPPSHPPNKPPARGVVKPATRAPPQRQLQMPCAGATAGTAPATFTFTLTFTLTSPVLMTWEGSWEPPMVPAAGATGVVAAVRWGEGATRLGAGLLLASCVGLSLVSCKVARAGAIKGALLLPLPGALPLPLLPLLSSLPSSWADPTPLLLSTHSWSPAWVPESVPSISGSS